MGMRLQKANLMFELKLKMDGCILKDWEVSFGLVSWDMSRVMCIYTWC